MKLNTKKSMLFFIFILTLVYAFSVFINNIELATISSILCILLATIITLVNMKNITKNRKILYFLVFLYNISYLSSIVLGFLQKYFDNTSIYLRYYRDLSYVMESFFIAAILVTVIFISMKFMDKMQFAIDFFAVFFTVYYITRPILSSVFSNFDFSLQSLNTVTITLFFDILISISIIVIIYTFRQKLDYTMVQINIATILIFLITDLVFVYQKIIGIFSEGTIFSFLYIIPHVLFAVTISM